MIRGISKRIIEVNDTGSDFFEKAVFYVKSGNNLTEKNLKEEADKIIYSYMSDSGSGYKFGYLRSKEAQKKHLRKKLYITLSVVSSILGALCFCLLYFL